MWVRLTLVDNIIYVNTHNTSTFVHSIFLKEKKMTLVELFRYQFESK